MHLWGLIVWLLCFGSSNLVSYVSRHLSHVLASLSARVCVVRISVALAGPLSRVAECHALDAGCD